MNKAHRCLLHLACITVKLTRGQDAQWHWEHLMREFGIRTELEKASAGKCALGKFHAVPHH